MKILPKSRIQLLILFLTLAAGVLGFRIGFRLTYCPLRCIELSNQVPVLVDLATGKTTELLVSSPHTSQKTGYFTHLSLGSAQGYRDGGVCCHITFPDQDHKISKQLYCHKCQTLLNSAGLTGFTVLYRDAQNNIRVCPIIPNTKYTLPGYLIQCFWENALVTLTVEPLS